MLNWLLFLPAALLLLGALGIVILRQTRPSIGYAWSIAALTTLITAGAALALRFRLPMQVAIEWWRPFAGFSSPPAFRLDLFSWPYAFALALIALAFILTDAARLETEAYTYNWAIGLALTALGIMTVLAANPITLVVAWTAVDMIELVLLMINQASRRMGMQTVTLFAVRVTGTLLVIVTMLYARSLAIDFDLIAVPSPLALLLLLAVGLRLGVLPLNLPYTREVYALRGLGNVLRLMGPATSLVVLSRLPSDTVPAEARGILLFFAALAAVYGAGMWLASESETFGRPFWMTAFSAFGIASVINGWPQASIAWGLALLLPGSLLFYFSSHRRQILWIPALGFLGILGLPFTPAASGWLGIFAPGAGLTPWFFWFAGLLLALGYLRHAYLRPRDELYRLERWVHTVFPVGLFALAAGQWAAALIGWPGSLTLGVWWAAAALVLFCGLGVVGFFSLRASWMRSASPSTEAAPSEAPAANMIDDPLTAPVPGTDDYVSGPSVPPAASPRVAFPRAGEEAGAARRWVEQFARRVGRGLAAVLRLNWLYRIFLFLYHAAQRVVDLFTRMLEGDGGILWSLVMLALLISLIYAGGSP